MRSFGCFLPVFRPEKWKHRTSLPQSTEVLPRKYGGLCPRSPMFSSRYSAFFMFFSAFFLFFCRNIRSVLLMLTFIYIVKLIALDGKTQKIRPKSALEGTRCLVKIFEGSRAFLQVIERVEMGNFRESVQFFGSVSAPRHGLSPLSQYS